MSSDNKRLAKNTVFLYLRMFFVLIISLYTSRIVINTLGISDYGIYNVVGSIVLFFSFLNATLASGMQRFYNYEGTKEGELGHARVYSTGFWIHIFMCAAIFIILEPIGIIYINKIMVIPPDRIFAAHIVFQCSLFSMLLLIVQIPYTSIILAKERMDFYAFVSIIDVFLKLLIVLILPYLPYDKLITFSTLTLIISISNFGLYLWYAKSRFRFLTLKIPFDKTLYKKLMSFSGWNLIGVFALLMRGQGVNLLLNAYFGTVINAARGVAYQVNNAIIGFSRNINTAFSPQVTNAYSAGNKDRVETLMYAESKICYFLILIIIVPVILEINGILHLWLGKAVPNLSNIFTILLLIDALIHTLNPPLSQVAYADGKIKGFQISTAIVNILLLPCCWLLFKLGYDAVSAFVATIIFSCIFQIVSLIYLHKIFIFSYSRYAKEVIIPCLVVTALAPLIPYLININMTDGIIRLSLVVFSNLVFTSFFIYFIGLNKSEKKKIWDLISRKINK